MTKKFIIHVIFYGGSIAGFLLFFYLLVPFVFANVEVSCDRTTQQFRQSGEITCGHIQWKLYTRHISELVDDPLPYLKQYETLYTHLAQFTGAEPANKRIVIVERCPSWKKDFYCPNGRNEKQDSLYLASGTNTINISEDFFDTVFLTLARDSRMPLSAVLFHEMGHAFLPQMQSTGYSLLWDNSSAESFVDLISIFSYLLRNDISGGMAPLYWDAFCEKKLHVSMCEDYLSASQDFLFVQKGYEQYIQDHDTFDTLFLFPQSQNNLALRSMKFAGLIGSLAEESGKRKALYDGLNKTMRFYNLSFSSPESWKVPFEAQTRDMTVQKTNLFVFLLSAYAQTDYAEKFQAWGFPVMRTVRENIFNIRANQYSEDLVPTYVKNILSESVSNVRLSSAFIQAWIEEPASGNALVIHWRNASHVQSIILLRSENEMKFPTVFARNVAGTEYRDTNLFEGEKYLYALVAYDVNGNESPVSTLLSGVPNPGQSVNYGQLFFTAHQVQDITTRSSRVAWQTNIPVTVRLIFGPANGAMSFSMETREYTNQNEFFLSGLMPGTTYNYQLTATDAHARTVQAAKSFFTERDFTLSGNQNVASSRRINIHETGTTNSVKIQWQTLDSTRFSSVRIYRSHSAWERGDFLANVASASYWYDNTLAPHTQYFYKIANVTPTGEEFFYEPIVAIISNVPRFDIQDVQLNVTGKKTVSLSWSAPWYFSSCARVRIYRSTVKGKKGARVGDGGCSGTFLEKLDPSVATRYYYSLVAVNTSKKESANIKQHDVIIPGRVRAIRKKTTIQSAVRKKTPAPAKQQPKAKVRIVPSWGYPPADQI
ncbi:fibronectin type III domain-containing protein [Candidatus Uhrbacteria bacterium]|nr:fibronectin type III domain-containing protein [Candidatus Uhrbacteria bacterium]